MLLETYKGSSSETTKQTAQRALKEVFTPEKLDQKRREFEALFGRPEKPKVEKPLPTSEEIVTAKRKFIEPFIEYFPKAQASPEEYENYTLFMANHVVADVMEQIKIEGFSNISGGLIGNLIENVYGHLPDEDLILNKKFQKDLVNLVLAKLSKEPGQFYFKLANSPASRSYVSAKTNSFGDLILATNLGEIQIEDATVLPNLQIYRGPLPGAEVQKSTEQLKNQPNLLETLESAKLNQINRALASIAKKLEISGSTQLNWLYNEILENLETVLTKNRVYLNNENSHEIEPFAREILKEVLAKFGENPNYKISYFNQKNPGKIKDFENPRQITPHILKFTIIEEKTGLVPQVTEASRARFESLWNTRRAENEQEKPELVPQVSEESRKRVAELLAMMKDGNQEESEEVKTAEQNQTLAPIPPVEKPPVLFVEEPTKIPTKEPENQTNQTNKTPNFVQPAPEIKLPRPEAKLPIEVEQELKPQVEKEEKNAELQKLNPEVVARIEDLFENWRSLTNNFRHYNCYFNTSLQGELLDTKLKADIILTDLKSLRDLDGDLLSNLKEGLESFTQEAEILLFAANDEINGITSSEEVDLVKIFNNVTDQLREVKKIMEKYSIDFK